MVSPLQKKSNRRIKRCFDIVASVFFLVVFCSWMFPIIIIISMIMVPGSPFFRQKRTGEGGRTFSILKFRTMPENEDADTRQAAIIDERCNKWGQWLRKTCLDEVPQLFNVLAGDMSLVGPRPHMLSHTEYYMDKIDGYSNRLSVLPGMTGYAAINGCRGETPELWMMQQRVTHDVWYIRNWSLWLDIKIIYKEFSLFFHSIISH